MNTSRNTIPLYIFFASILIMFIGFLFSRAILSIGTVLIITNGFLQNNWKERWAVFVSDKYLVGITCLFLFPFLSGLWSENKTEWLNMMQVKLPLLLLPFALALQKGVTKKHLTLVALHWVAFIFFASVWSTVQYLLQWELYNQLYHSSKVIPTLASNDHIRFSMAVIIAILLWLKLKEWKTIQGSTMHWLLNSIMIWFVFYLHLLGAKTGLLGLYAIVVPLILYQLFATGKKTMAIAGLFFMLSLPVIAYNLLPTFKTRIGYILYDAGNWRAGNLNGSFSDGNRILTMQSGWNVFQKNWLAGVGYGDIKTETNKWYNVHAPSVPLSERFLPLNQWLISGSGAGIVAVFLFTIVVLLPYGLRQWKKNKQAIAFITFMNLVFLYECTIDDQFGVYLFTFFTLYWHLTNRPSL